MNEDSTALSLSQVKLQYERVPHHREAHVHHLDDPVVEYMELVRPLQLHRISGLPRGKYIVCGEAMEQEGRPYQESCFEATVLKEKSESKFVF